MEPGGEGKRQGESETREERERERERERAPQVKCLSCAAVVETSLGGQIKRGGESRRRSGRRS